MDETQLDFIKDMVKSEGWKIYQDLVGKRIDLLRRNATNKQYITQDSTNAIWYAAEAEGMERSAKILDTYLEG